jgi:RNA polymerase sigma factor (TIGR02999 family)
LDVTLWLPIQKAQIRPARAHVITFPVKEDVTGLLAAWRSGDTCAGTRLAETLYAELRQLARYYFAHERRGSTLQATALVHELYLRLFSRNELSFQNKSHLMAVAARELRRILTDHARRVCAAKRGGRSLKIGLSGLDFAVLNREQEILEIDELLQRLSEVDRRVGQVVEMRFFGGLEEAEIAESLSVSVATVKRDWRFARAWFIKMIRAGREKDPREPMKSK